VTFWDFISVSLYQTGAWVSQYWLWLAALCILICLIGWQLSAKNVQVDEPSQEQKDALKAWVMRGKMPPSLFPEWYKAADEAEMIADACMAEYEGFDNPS
jgi:hypothetical protein